MTSAATDGEATAFEVFARFGGWEKPLQHVGSVRAGDPDLAWHMAKETYTRRDRCFALWVVPRSCLRISTDRDLVTLGAGGRMGYRLPGFPSAHRRARRKQGQPDEAGRP